VERLTYRLLPYCTRGGAENMAADETMLHTAAASGLASFRFYAWSSATASLGYFQPAAVLANDPLLRGLPWVRRPSGGATLVHHHELTYALALPPQLAGAHGQHWIARMHQIIARALAALGVHEGLVVAGTANGAASPLCYHQITPGDLLLQGVKICGSAQRKQRGCLLQHGGLLLARSEYTPQLPGLADLSAAKLNVQEMSATIVDALSRETGWQLEAADWRPEEREATAHLVQEKYAHTQWNEKR